MARCAGYKQDGSQCSHIVGAAKHYCYNHDPERVQERKRNASKGGRTPGGSGEIKNLKAQLQSLADLVFELKCDPKVAAVIAQILNTKLRAIEIERKTREQEEILERLEALERV